MSEFNVTELAIEKIKEYMEQNKIDSALRIALMQGGCSGPSLGLALDEAKEDDKTFTIDDIKFLIEESVLNTSGGINVDFADAGPRSGFTIASTNPMGEGGGCGSCSSGSCG